MEDNRGDIMQILSASPTLIVSIVIFIICVVIGFFGDKRLKNEKMLKEQSRKNKNEAQTTSDIESSEDSKSDAPLITSQNVNSVVDSNDNKDLGNLYSIGNDVSNNINNVAMPNMQESNQDLNNPVNNNPVIDEDALASNPSFNMPVENEPVNVAPTNQSSVDVSPNLNAQNTLNSTNNGMPQAFDGQITSDDKVNNVF